MAKPRLGRGLDALLSDNRTSHFSSTEVTSEEGFSGANRRDLPEGIHLEEDGSLSLDISRLIPNPHQPRVEFEEEALTELSQSIKEHGVIQPVTIEDAGDGQFYIIAGERRTRAAKLAGLTKIPVQLKKYSEEKKLEVALIENIQREDLNPIEEALAYNKLMEMGQLSQEELARRVGKNRSTVANALRLLKLPEDMQSALINGEITAGHARALLSVNDVADQRILFGRIVGSSLSVRDAEQQAAELNKGGRISTTKSSKKESPTDPDLQYIQQQFIDILGTKVSIKGSLERGSISIDYYSKDDLDRLYSIIAGNNTQ